MIPTSRNMARSLTALVLLTSFVAGQRPFFAGTRPIGFPETPNRTTTTQDPLGNRFGEGTTERLPIEANGDRDLIDRLSKLPIDKQPFWFINWQALEEHRKKPQTYPQRPNVFVDSVPLNTNPQSSSFSANSASNTAFSAPAPAFNPNTGNNFGNPNGNNFQFSAPAVPNNNFNTNTENRNNFETYPNSEAQFGLNPTVGSYPSFAPNGENYSFVSNTLDINGLSFNSKYNDGGNYGSGSSASQNANRPNSGLSSNVAPTPGLSSSIGPTPGLSSNTGPSPGFNANIRPNSGITSNIQSSGIISNVGNNPGFTSNIGTNTGFTLNVGTNSGIPLNIPSSATISNIGTNPGFISNVGPNPGFSTNTVHTNLSASNLNLQYPNAGSLLLNNLGPNTSNISFNAFANSFNHSFANTFNNSYVKNETGFFVQSFKTDSFASHASSAETNSRYPVKVPTQQLSSQEYY